MLHYKVNFNDLIWEEPLEGVKCKIYKHGDKQLRLVDIQKKCLFIGVKKDIMGTFSMVSSKLNTKMKRYSIKLEMAYLFLMGKNISIGLRFFQNL